MPIHTPNTYLELPIGSTQNEVAATGPQLWANTVVEAAVKSAVAPDLLERLQAGNIDIGVMFGPEDPTANYPEMDNNAIYGGVKADGRSLAITQAVIGGSDRVAVTFRREGPGKPYMPKACEDNGERTLFPETSGSLPGHLMDSLGWVALGARNVNEKLTTSVASRKYVPYVRIAEL